LKHKVLLVGASTGGPSQIKELLSYIKNLSITIVIAQHMEEEILPYFTKDLQESLSMKILTTPLNINFSVPSVIICSQSSIIIKENSTYKIVSDKIAQEYTPDINKLFNSFIPYAHKFNLEVIIMTGIGRDGIDGAKNLKNKGAKIFAQDKASSPVYGMPKAAFESGIVDSVKSLNELKTYFENL